jgi:hypothetical protein
MNRPPAGITPPAPGLDHEEPAFWNEDDIPSDDGGRAAARSNGSERGGQREERGKIERE